MRSDFDPFEGLARYYDAIMEHVDYERWYCVASALAEALPVRFRHVDAACGTGTLIGMLRDTGWNSIGLDQSFAMVHQGRRIHGGAPMIAADLRALPLAGSADFVTCLFDSVNFLLEEEAVRQTLRSFAEALCDGGLLYFDIVTLRMVKEHFEGQTWSEDNGRFLTTWSSTFDRKTAIVNTKVRVNNNPAAEIRERIYPRAFLEEAVEAAGLTLMGVVDAFSWKKPTRRSTRIDFVAAKNPDAALRKRIEGHLKRVPDSLPV